MASVYTALDEATGAQVAVKLLSRSSPEVVDRFLREAEILAELSHPAIVGHVAHGIDDGAPYLVMQWVNGVSLGELLARRRTLTVPETMSFARAIADALGLIHARGIVHRDVKPSNIIVEDGAIDRPVLLDFGIAHLVTASGELTRTGELLGTPGYLAPEQASGHEVDASADIFALGCVLFRCLAGRSPFEARDALAGAVKVLVEDAPRISERVADVPREIDELLHRMLARDRRLRPTSGAELTAALTTPLDPPTLDDRTLRRAPRSANPGSTRTLGGEERRVVSIVIARRPDWEPSLSSIEAVREILDESLEPLGMRASILADGTIAAAAQDEAPHDAALRAARAASAILEELPHSQVVVATGRAEMDEEMPVGETVERAMGLLDRKREGIIVDTTTAGLLAGRFTIEEQAAEDGTLRVLAGESRAMRTLLGRPSRLIGRTRELVTLEAMLDEVRIEGVSRAMVVLAEPGFGKSRLVAELGQRAAARGTTTWTSWGDPATRGSPLSMLRGFMLSAADISDADRAPVRQRKIAHRVAQLGCSPEVGELLTETVAPLEPGGPELRAVRRDRLLFATSLRNAWCALVTAACRAGPLMLVLEDLHWGDARTVELVDAALHAARDLPLFVVAAGRPDLAKAFPDLFSAHGTQQLKLLGLTPRASAELVRHALPSLPEPAVAAIVTRAQGNALFLEELIRAAAEGRSDSPETLVAMMQQRLSLLTSEARRVLRAVAIFGESAPLDGVHALVAGDRAALVAELGRLASAELLQPIESGYAFRHALLREASYATLTADDAKLGHQLAGEWLEARGHDSAILAGHFLAAGDHARARDYFFTAAESALANNDLDASLALAARVEALEPEVETITKVRLLQAEANLWRNNPAAVQQAEEILSLAPPASRTWYRAAAGVLFLAGQVADLSRLVSVVARLEADPHRADDRPTASMQIMAYSMAAWLLASVGVRERARGFIERALDLDSRGLADETAQGWLGIGRHYIARYDEGNPWRALTSARAAYERFSSMGDVRLTVLAQIIEALTLIELGAPGEALAIFERVMATCDLVDLQAARGDAKRWQAGALAALGRTDEAIVLARAALAETRSELTFGAAAQTTLAALLLQSGRVEEAKREARAAADALAFAPSAGAHALAVLAQVELRAGDLDAALAAAERAVGIVEATGVIASGEASMYRAAAEVREARGDHAGATAAIARGVAAVRRRAEGIADPALRRSFERVADNAWLLDRA